MWAKVSSWISHVILHFPHSHSDRVTRVCTRDGLILQTADIATDLGVTVDTDLKFYRHVQTIIYKASGLAHSLFKTTV